MLQNMEAILHILLEDIKLEKYIEENVHNVVDLESFINAILM